MLPDPIRKPLSGIKTVVLTDVLVAHSQDKQLKSSKFINSRVFGVL